MLTTKPIRLARRLPQPSRPALQEQQLALQQLPRVPRRHRRNRNCSLESHRPPAQAAFYFYSQQNFAVTLRCQITSMEVRKMFGDTLLESSSAPRKGKRWPMATAFTAEAIIGGLLVIIPLLSTGVIPVSARVPIYTPIKPVTLERVERARTDHTSSGPVNSGPRMKEVVLFNDNPNAIYRGAPVDITLNPAEVRDPEPNGTGGKKLSDFMSDAPVTPNVKFGGPKRITSQLSEGQLVNRVEPVYPR